MGTTTGYLSNCAVTVLPEVDCIDLGADPRMAAPCKTVQPGLQSAAAESLKADLRNRVLCDGPDGKRCVTN